MSRYSPRPVSCNDRIAGYGESLIAATSLKIGPLESVCRSQRLHPAAHEVRQASSHRGGCGAGTLWSGFSVARQTSSGHKEHRQRQRYMPQFWTVSIWFLKESYELNLYRPLNIPAYKARVKAKKRLFVGKINRGGAPHTGRRIHGATQFAQWICDRQTTTWD